MDRLWRPGPRPTGRCRRARRGPRPAALVGVLLGSLSSGTPRSGHVDLLAVAPEQRRRGVGRALLRRAERALAALGRGRGAAGRQPAVLRVAGHRRPLHPGGLRRAGARLPAGPDRLEHDRGPVVPTGSPALRSTEAAERRLAGQGVTVRRAEPADLPALTEFARTTFGGSVGRRAGRARWAAPGAGCHLAGAGRRGARLRRVRLVPAELVRADGHRAGGGGLGHRRGAAAALPARPAGGGA